ncbi:hypothetical protein D3C71_1988870 [compost metagenome]
MQDMLIFIYPTGYLVRINLFLILLPGIDASFRLGYLLLHFKSGSIKFYLRHLHTETD